MRYYLFSLVLLFQVQWATAQKQDYAHEMAGWKEKRLAALKSEQGWLNLAGLFWLQQGKNTLGSDTSNLIVFPFTSFPANVGYFDRQNDRVNFVATQPSVIQIAGKPVLEAIVFDHDLPQVPVMTAGHLQWTLIQREDRIGIRLRDLSHPAINALKEIPSFPLDTNWQIKAKLIRPILPTTIAIKNVLGQTTQQNSPGKLLFVLQGKEYQLDALQEGNELFIVFGDASAGKESYGAGRFLYAAMPDADGYTMLDFNRAINPPCAFTPYATCPLPPQQNILPFTVRAGEKDPHFLDH